MQDPGTERTYGDELHTEFDVLSDDEDEVVYPAEPTDAEPTDAEPTDAEALRRIVDGMRGL